MIPPANDNGDRIIRLQKHYNSEIELPSSILLGVHATIAKIVHASGMADVIDKTLEEIEDLCYLATDGTPNFLIIFTTYHNDQHYGFLLVTGASRGFGLALVRLLTSLPSSDVGKVFACPRGNSPGLEELAKEFPDRVVIVKLDVTNQESIAKAVIEVEKKLEGKGLDVLINNVGICQYAPNGVKSMDNLEESFTVNVMGVHWVTRAFLPLLYKGNMKKVANISTTLGSITLARAAHYLPAPAYKISKAAMDALTVPYALDYEKEGFTFMALCPGIC
ncbi:short chain dehydrogenase [Aspergillus sclerotialis]|uniref:Short chain dehydrogenase n=1 Tax=Aspergillus sclerotialis TaxID=2070753 RepID=A0A3A3A8K6_9EURO|nr:short chain dehydrogenase [Aspergillus sclerotialis]